MKSSVKKGVRQLLLSDMPTSVSSRHLAQSIFVGMGTRFALAAALSLGVFSAFASGIVPGTASKSQHLAFSKHLACYNMNGKHVSNCVLRAPPEYFCGPDCGSLLHQNIADLISYFYADIDQRKLCPFEHMLITSCKTIDLCWLERYLCLL